MLLLVGVSRLGFLRLRCRRIRTSLRASGPARLSKWQVLSDLELSARVSLISSEFISVSATELALARAARS